MKNHYDLENEILNLHSIVSDLDTLSENILEGRVTEDEIVNVLLGMSKMMEMRLDQLFDTHCQVFKLDQYWEGVYDDEEEEEEEIELIEEEADEQTDDDVISLFLVLEIDDEDDEQ